MSCETEPMAASSRERLGLACRGCKANTATLQDVWIDIGERGVSVGIRAPLCSSCAAGAADKIRAELSSPLVKSVMLVAGARLGISV